MELEPLRPTATAPGDTFTGTVYVNPLHTPREPSRLVASMVRFTPGARTNWHSHELGQTLHCTDGEGLVVSRDGTVIRLRAGDTVWTRPARSKQLGQVGALVLGEADRVGHRGVPPGATGVVKAAPGRVPRYRDGRGRHL